MILAIETAATVCGIGLAENETTCTELSAAQPGAHAENILPLIREIVHRHGISLRAIDAIAVSQGPGSFTGLRIGMSAAKGLSYGLDVPLISVPTLPILAYQACETGRPICAVLPSIRGEFFYQFFTGDPLDESARTPPGIGKPDTISSQIQDTMCLACDPTDERNQLFIRYMEQNSRFVDIINSQLSGAQLAQPALQMLKQKRFANRTTVEPLYLRVFPERI